MHTIISLLLSDYFFYGLLTLFLIVNSTSFYSSDKISGFDVFLFIAVLSLLAVNYYTVITLPQLFVAILLYLFFGLLWSIVKWKMYVKKKISVYDEKCIAAKDREAKGSNYKPEYYERDKAGYLAELHRDTNIAINKGHIKSWIGFWPVSLIVTCTYDIIDNIYTYCSGIYRKAVESAFASAKIPNG